VGIQLKQAWIAVVVGVGVAAGVYVVSSRAPALAGAAEFDRPVRVHLDHAAYFAAPFASPQAVTRACLKCHPQAAADMMRTAHWQWLGQEVSIPGHAKPQRIGKKNLLNNFCLTTVGNRASCTKCHVGYGWVADPYDFSRGENVDCLVCHERTGAYVKGEGGLPVNGTDLRATARSVGFPKRENCSVCHSYGGGGQGVKHGDLDSSLENPTRDDDVHMGQYGLLCIDCHRTKRHEIAGRAFSVSVNSDGAIGCRDCHKAPPHRDPRIERHLAAVACQTCHIPTYARKLPTKTFWDWSKGGDETRSDDPHKYLKIKGEFVYDHDIVPEYGWFDGTVERYMVGDPMDPAVVTDINRPRGSLRDAKAQIWPFKVHRALQPYDRKLRTLLPPVLSGEGGFWHDFDWDKALRLGAAASGVAFSGEFGFAKTAMYWPLSHMVTPKEKALTCNDCHGNQTRMDWKALGYDGDPLVVGGRR
jgi:octaheme c-type cytochrome (tetrathionate reductase family)